MSNVNPAVQSTEPRTESHLVEHARRELQRAGLFDKDSDYGGAIGEAVLDLINKFASQGHSGFSAELATEIFDKLVRFQVLAPITADPEEWMDVSQYGGPGSRPIWQNRRQPSIFSNDGGQTWYDVNIESLRRAYFEMEARKDDAYLERNKLVAALSKLFPAGTARTAIEGWSEDWHGCVYIDLPTGQVSWHYHASQAELFAHLPPYEKPWDGHTTEEKYERLAAFEPLYFEHPDSKRLDWFESYLRERDATVGAPVAPPFDLRDAARNGIRTVIDVARMNQETPAKALPE